MNDSISVSGLLLALALPWLCGAVWIHWLLRYCGRFNAYIVVGQGYFIGLFAVSLVIRGRDLLGYGLDFWSITAVLTVFCVTGCLLLFLQNPAQRDPPESLSIPGWQKLTIAVLLMLVAWRYLSLLQQILVKPLYAWDAWMNWAPKAIVWFHRGELVEHVGPERWLQLSDMATYTLGNPQASTYPISVPVIQLWSMLGLGTWDHSALLLSWFFVPLCLGMALFGHLRQAGIGLLPAVLACYLLVNLPYLNVHTVLGGYADIWLAGAFSLAVFSLREFGETRHWSFACLALFAALFCSQLKNPGIVLGLIVALVTLREFLKLNPVKEYVGAGFVVVLLVLCATLGINLNIPFIGQVAINTGGGELPGLGRFALEYHAVSSAVLESLFFMLNWNLLWYLLPLAAMYRLSRGRLPSRIPSEVLASLAGLLFILFVFYFTRHYRAADNFVTLNRALLYVIPTLIYMGALLIHKSGRVQLLENRHSA